MLKLMKYEFKKQKFSKLVILFLAALIEAYFMYGIIVDSNNAQNKALVFLMILAFGAIFFVSFEAIFTFNNDLKQKCSYMLFLTPKSSYSIVGAKVITSGITILVTGLAFLGLFFANGAILATKYESFSAFLDFIKDLLNQFVNIDVDPAFLVLTLITVLFNWILTLTLAFFSITLSTTFLADKKAKGVVSFAIFMTLNLIFAKILSLCTNNMSSSDNTILVMASIIEIVFVIITYLGTAWMLEKKVSV